MAVRDYSKAKIYKIVADTNEEYQPYIGSTIEELCQRMSGHRCYYKKWKKNGKGYVGAFDLFDKVGVENCHIVLLEEYSCDSKMKLLMKEREWFDKIKNCNKYKPFISKEELVEYMKEYREEHKEELVEYMKEYREEHKEELAEKKKVYNEHKEELAEKKKVYYNEHKEEFAEKKKEYYKKNKKEIVGKKKKTYECSCGSILQISDKAKHEKTKKHISFISK